MAYIQSIVFSLKNLKLNRAIKNIEKTITILQTMLKLELGMIIGRILDLMMTF